jgi:diguanylate cyclase (GGDEF)-like protein/PAS domain S-box-containing protein
LTPESREEFPAYLANIQRDKTVKGSLAIQTRSGEIRVLEYNNNLRTQGVITPIVRCIAHDITEHLQADIALKESERQYRTILDSLGDSIHVVDEELNFVFINQNFLKWNQELNLTTDVIGKGIFDVFPFLPKKVLDEYKQVFKDNEVLVTEEITILHDQEIYTETRKIPLLRENKVDQVVTVVRDITERKKSEHTLQESEERFRYIFDTAAVAIWEEDFSQAVAVIDDLKSGGVKDFRQYLDENPQAIVQAMQMIKILDINQQTLDMYGAKSKDELLASLDKISVPETHEIIKEELIAIAEGRRFFAGETVNKTLQGKRIDVLLTMSLPEHASEFDSVLVSVMDITKSKQAERALQESEARYRQIIETAQEGIWIIDSENKTTFVNQKIAEMLDYTTEEMIGVPIFAFMADESKAFSDDFTDRRRQGLVEQQDLNFKCKNGATLWAIVSTSSLFNDKGVYTGALVMMTDITSRKKAEGMLRHFSTHDVLTGLYNRAFFEEQVSRLEQERDFPVSIVVADIDDLKVTNDLHGHAAGDELLRQVAQSLTSAFRREDIIARIGGDEFAVLLPNANQEGVKKILRRIKDNVQAYNAAHQDIPFNLSLGTSVVKIGDSLSEAIKRADKKMYLEKHGKKR